MTLGIYCRISKLKEDGKDRSIDNQQKLGIEKAKKLKLKHRLYTDEGLSGTLERVEDRPALNNLLQDIIGGDITAVFAYDQSRFERNPQMRFAIMNIFKEYQVKYYTHIDGLVDLHDPQSELFGDMVSLFNKYEVTKTKMKVRSVLKQRAEEGKAHGIIPYGYTRDKQGYLAIDSTESKIVKRIFSLSLSGTGTRSIAELLNTEGIPTRYNKMGKGTLNTKNKFTGVVTTTQKKDIRWSGNTIRNIIVNTLYKGERIYSKQIITVPPIVDPVYWKKVNDNLANNANNTGKKVVHRYLLKGLIRCEFCGRNMYGRSRESKKDHYYMCSSKRILHENCGNRSINIIKLESFIWEQLFVKKDFAKRVEIEFKYNKNKLQLIKDSIDNEKKIITRLTTEKQRAITLLLEDFKGDAEFKTVLQKKDNSIKEAKLRLKDLEFKFQNMKEGQGLVHNLKNNFVEYTNVTSFSQKKNLINEYIQNITIGFVDDSHYNIDIEYKGGLGTENWKTPDHRANNFYTRRKDKNGKWVIMVSSPSSLNYPEDKSNEERFRATTGDFKMVSNSKNKVRLPKVKEPKW